MTPDQAIKEARAGELRPVYLVTGEERFLVDEVAQAIRAAATLGGIAGFNEDKFTAGEASVDKILGAARMVPMMGPRRFVLVRAVDRWETKRDSDDRAADGAVTDRAASPLDQLAEYAKNPVPSTVMLLLAAKLHGQRKLVSGAKKAGFIVTCEPIARRDLPEWIDRYARAAGHKISPEVSDLLAEISGPELSSVADALDRLSLFVGPKQPITEDAVGKIVTRVRQSTVWELLDALGRRRLDRAMAALGDVFDPRDGGLRLVGTVSWSVRQLIKFESALREGKDPAEAAQRAGVAPFKARDVAQVVRSVPRPMLERWMTLLSEADVALKGSKLPPRAVLEATVIEMCR